MITYVDELAERIRLEVDLDALPAGDTRLLFLMYAVLGRAKGADVAREDVHDAWVAWMTARGERHESMVPFDDLSPEIQAEDGPFLLAIRRAVAP